MESGTIPLLWFVLTGAIWAAAVLQNQRLLRLIEQKLPDVAAREIPFAFSRSRHPEKAFFFLRKRSKALLRADPEVWRERCRFLWLLLASLVFPPAGFAA